MIKRITAFVIAAAFCLMQFTVLPMTVFAAETSGICGDKGNNVTWSYDESARTLTISGSGAMKDYTGGTSAYEKVPWADCMGTMEKIVIESGVTRIGNFAFTDMVHVRTADIPDTRYINRQQCV